VTDNHNGAGPTFSIRLTATADARLAKLAQDSGLSKSKLAAYLLEELIPSVDAVRTRLQIVRKPSVPAR
jgi:hypothetical protein